MDSLETGKEMNVQSGNGQEFLYRFYIGEERGLGVYDLILICIHENRKYIYLLLAKFFRDVIENLCLNLFLNFITRFCIFNTFLIFLFLFLFS